MFAGQAALLSLAGESKVFFKCLNRWLPRSLEVKIKTCAWGLRAQNAIYSSSFISSGISAWGLRVLEAHAHSAKNNSQMVIYNFEVAYSMKAFHCERCCRCKSWIAFGMGNNVSHFHNGNCKYCSFSTESETAVAFTDIQLCWTF